MSFAPVVTVCSCPNKPGFNGAVTTVNGNSTLTEHTVTTGANDNYLFVYPVSSAEVGTIAWEDVLNSIQIEQNNTVTDFEPYVGNAPSPSPAYPQSVESVGDMKNLLNLSEGAVYNNGAISVYSEPSLTVTKTSVSTNCCSVYLVGKVEDLAKQTVYAKGAFKGTGGQVTLGYADGDGNNRITVVSNGSLTDEFSTSMAVNADTYAGKYVAIWFYADLSKNGAIGDKGIYSNVMVTTAPSIGYAPYGKYALGIKQVGKNLYSGGDQTFTRRKTVVLDEPLSPGTYIVSAFVTSTDTDNMSCSIGFIGGRVDGTNVYRSFSRNFLDSEEVTIYNSVSALYLNAADDYANGADDTATWKDIMIRKADIEDDTYEPYHSNTITIPLSEPLREGDEIAVVDGVWGVNRKSVSVTYKGTETWFDSGKAWYVNTDNDISLTAFGYADRLLSDKATARNWNAVTTGEANNIFTIYKDSTWSKARIAVYVNDTFSDSASWKAWLAENPMEFEYELATPVFEPFADQTPFYGMKSYDTVTYISTDSKVEPSIEVKFGRTEVGALTLENSNLHALNDILVAKLEAEHGEDVAELEGKIADVESKALTAEDFTVSDATLILNFL